MQHGHAKAAAFVNLDRLRGQRPVLHREPAAMRLHEVALGALELAVGHDENQVVGDGRGQRVEVARFDGQQVPAERFTEVHLCTSEERSQETRLNTIEAPTACQNPSTWKPSTRCATPRKISPLMMKMKRPSVRMVAGSVR